MEGIPKASSRAEESQTSERKDDIEKAPNGWVTNYKLSKDLHAAEETITEIAEKFKSEHPEWFKNYKVSAGASVVRKHYSPELSEVIKKELEKREIAPDGWITKKALATELGVSEQGISSITQEFRETNPEWFKNYYITTGGQYEHYSPELKNLIKGKVEELYVEPPEGWVNTEIIAKRMGVSHPTVRAQAQKLSKEFPNQIGRFKPKGQNKASFYYGPDLATAVESQSHLVPPPEGWVSRTKIAKELKADITTIMRIEEELKQFHEGPKEFKGGTFYSPFFAQRMRDTVPHLPPEGWVTTEVLAKKLNADRRLIADLASEVEHKFKKSRYDTTPNLYFGKFRAGVSGGTTTFYSPKSMKLIEESLNQRMSERPPSDWETIQEIDVQIKGWASIYDKVKKLGEILPNEFKKFSVDKNGNRTGMQMYFSPKFVKILKESLPPPAPTGWKTLNAIAKENERSPELVEKIISRIKDNFPGEYGNFKSTAGISPFYSPEFQAGIKLSIEEKSKLKNEKKDREILSQKLETFTQEMAGGETLESQKFQKLLSVFGTAKVFDILYKYRPEFSSLPPEHVKGELAKYLGDFLILRNSFKIEDLEVGVPYLSDQSFKEALFEVAKESCLTYYHKKKLEHSPFSDREILAEYINSIRKEAQRLESIELNEIADDVEHYYSSLLSDFEKPPRIVDALKEGRTFPDLNQVLNIKEIQDKKKMLIGDEMGMGKSASAILSKEYLGAKLAVVVVPSNVIDTWKGYLSDAYDAEQGKQVGYFKPGSAPKVLVVEDLESIPDDASEFEYVLVSQERMNKRYLEKLQALEYDMLIVDEVHKLKNLEEGQRSKHVLELAEKIEGEDKHLVLLSGTPVPNKVKDVAMVLKLLYPEKFKDFKNEELTNSIINGDLVDLRNLLVPRMQMKSLRESIEMPNLTERVLETELTPEEREIYEVLLDDDELTADQKIRAFRKFTLNPASLEITPSIEGSKVRDVRQQLHTAFEFKKKVVLFVNSYVDGIIRGENTIIEKFNLPPDVQIRIIDGQVPRGSTVNGITGMELGRKEIQDEFAKSNEKILLVVSGQTADVGVDFSPAEEIVMYNEPWTEFDKRQQIARAYRPGLEHDLDVVTSITKGTIEEGIQEYIQLKFDAIQKLLKGVPITEIEKNILKTAEKQETPDIEGDATIAKEWLNSPQNRLHRFFAITKESGEENFRKFLLEHGDEYAESYVDMGSRGFQANTGRVVGALLDRFIEEKKQDPKELRILDIASGPEILKKHVSERYQDDITSLDINPLHFQGEGANRIVGSFLRLPVKEKSIDYTNLSLALHYSLDPRRGMEERLQVFQEMNRVLKEKGRAVINLTYSRALKDPEKFEKVMDILGFKVVKEVSGDISEGDTYLSHCIVLEKKGDTPSLEEVSSKIGKELLDGLKLANTEVSSLRNGRRILSRFEINGTEVTIPLNTEDKTLLTEEQNILKEGKELQQKYGSTKAIPKEEIVNRGFLKIFNGKNYRLLKKSERIGGFVEIR